MSALSSDSAAGRSAGVPLQSREGPGAVGQEPGSAAVEELNGKWPTSCCERVKPFSLPAIGRFADTWYGLMGLDWSTCDSLGGLF